MARSAQTERTHDPSGRAADDDATVLADVHAGRIERFALLVDRYKVELYRYVLYRTRDVHAAEDLTQDVFLRVFRAGRAGSFAGRSTVRTWLFTIAGNCLRDHWRAARRNRETPVGDLSDVQPMLQISGETGPPENAAAAERREQVMRTLAELPDEQQQAVGMKFFGGLTLAEIAEATGAALPTVKSRVRYGLMKLARQLPSELRCNL